MNRSHSIRVFLTVLISVVVLRILAAQTVPGGEPSVSLQGRQIPSDRGQVARCLEELDVPACKRAQKLPLTAKERSQVLTYEFVAQPPGNAATLLDKAIAVDPQNALAYFLRAHIAANDQGVRLYLKAIELNPEWKRYYVDVALLSDNADSYKSNDQGLQLWQRALESAPDGSNRFVLEARPSGATFTGDNVDISKRFMMLQVDIEAEGFTHSQSGNPGSQYPLYVKMH